MDAFFHKLASSMLFTSVKSVPAETSKKVLVTPGAPRSHMMRQPHTERDLPRSCIAYWDKKREKCNNCQHIYLKTLSKHPGFCSVDCKSNMVYLEKINRTINAMKNAVQEQCRQKEQEMLIHQEKQQLLSDNKLEIVEIERKTFAEFGLESRILEASNVEWAFSAMY